MVACGIWAPFICGLPGLDPELRSTLVIPHGPRPNPPQTRGKRERSEVRGQRSDRGTRGRRSDISHLRSPISTAPFVLVVVVVLHPARNTETPKHRNTAPSSRRSSERRRIRSPISYLLSPPRLAPPRP